MSYARNIRRRQQREGQPHLMMLGSLLGDFYEFLSKQPQPTDNEVRSLSLVIISGRSIVKSTN